MKYRKNLISIVLFSFLVGSTPLMMGASCQIGRVIGQIMGLFKQTPTIRNEKFLVSVMEFLPENCDDPWFCESLVRKKLKKAIDKGVREVAKQRQNVTLSRPILGDAASQFYERMKQNSEGGRKQLLSAIAKNNNANLIIFGRYRGDDYEMVWTPYMYSSKRQALAKGETTTFSRKDPELEEKIARLTRDMLLQVLDN